MLLSVDVAYTDPQARVAGVLFADWSACAPAHTVVVDLAAVAPYVPGSFYQRELPCVQALLAAVPVSPTLILIDGYVWLADERTPGLGGHLFAALQGRIPVVGVAKTRFHSATVAVPVLRGGSRQPLYVTAAGYDVQTAAEQVRTMPGPYRVPTLLRWADQLCRGHAQPEARS
jgi:deoxyribonuclease V